VRVAFFGGTGPVGTSTVPRLLAAGHAVLVAHSGGHEPVEVAEAEHVHGDRAEVIPQVERWKPDVLIDTFAGGATAAKARELGDLAARSGVRRVVAISSMDVYAHCSDAGVDDAPVTELAHHAVPLTEDAPQRAPHAAGSGHDNVAMEHALGAAPYLTVLRPGAIYGPHPDLHAHCLREWHLVGKVYRGERRLVLPDGGTQLFQRVALERIGRAITATATEDVAGALNVGDPSDFTYGGLAALVAEQLDWTWEIEHARWPAGDHPWNVRQPVLADTTRMRIELGVTEPRPTEATRATIDWLWEHRAELAEREQQDSGGQSAKPVP
jgi:nucleoside-diphosphate-sugar epimerase